jgi:hypothetical protein
MPCHAMPCLSCYLVTLLPVPTSISACSCACVSKLGAHWSHWTMRPAASCPLARPDTRHQTRPSPQPREGSPVLPEALEAFHIETPKSKANKSLDLYVTAPPLDHPFLFPLPNFPNFPIWIAQGSPLIARIADYHSARA